MKVLLHGAVNLSNFGDYLFAEIFYTHLKDNGVQAEFYTHKKYGIGSFYRKHLRYSPSTEKVIANMAECNALVYFSGGYFRESSKRSIWGQLKHVYRYLVPGVYFMAKRKPIYVLGVGAGPFSKGLFSRIAKRILDYAEIVTVRNEESLSHCRTLGVKRNIEVTTDTALVIKEFYERKKKPVCCDMNHKKRFVFHAIGNPDIETAIRNNIIPGVEKFLRAHPEYEVYVVADSTYQQEFYDRQKSMLGELAHHVIKYQDPWELCDILAQADVVVTTKLHVGIVSCAFGASVLPFPADVQKTERFYRQIGEGERCVALRLADEDVVSEKLEQYCDKKINIPDELIAVAKRNLEYLPQ